MSTQKGHGLANYLFYFLFSFKSNNLRTSIKKKPEISTFKKLNNCIEP